MLVISEKTDNVVRITLNRPDLHNAFNAELIAELTQVFQQLDKDNDARVVLLTGAGKSFSAGADLNWMRSMVDASEAENRDDSLRLAGMFRAINHCRKPVIAAINGHAFGGGVGLAACADIVIASEQAKFGLTEVKLGLIPATIAPFVQAKIGASQMRRLAISGEIISAEQARQIGLVHAVCAREQLDTVVQQHISTLLQAGPVASSEAKRLVEQVAAWSSTAAAEVDLQTAAWIARLRVSDEGQQGLQAFLQKQPAAWSKQSKDSE